MEIEIVLPVILLLLLIAYFRTSTEETQNESQSHDSLPINPKRSHRKARSWYEDSETHFEDEPGHLAFLVSLDENGGKLKKLCKEGGKDIEEVLVYIRSVDHLLHSAKTIVRNYSEMRYIKYFGTKSEQNAKSQLDKIKRSWKEDPSYSYETANDEAKTIDNEILRGEAYLFIKASRKPKRKIRRGLRFNEIDFSPEKLRELKWPEGLTYEEKLAHIKRRKHGGDFVLALKFARKMENEYPQVAKDPRFDTDYLAHERQRIIRNSSSNSETSKRKEVNIDRGELNISDLDILRGEFSGSEMAGGGAFSFIYITGDDASKYQFVTENGVVDSARHPLDFGDVVLFTLNTSIMGGLANRMSLDLAELTGNKLSPTLKIKTLYKVKSAEDEQRLREWWLMPQNNNR